MPFSRRAHTPYLPDSLTDHGDDGNGECERLISFFFLFAGKCNKKIPSPQFFLNKFNLRITAAP